MKERETLRSLARDDGMFGLLVWVAQDCTIEGVQICCKIKTLCLFVDLKARYLRKVEVVVDRGGGGTQKGW